MLQVVSPGQIVPKAESVRLALVQLYAPIPGRASVESRRIGNIRMPLFSFVAIPLHVCNLPEACFSMVRGVCRGYATV